jgi:hypothetical protein
MRYLIGATGINQAQSITLSIDNSLRMSPLLGDPDADCQAAWPNLMAEYPGLDFQCHFSRAGYYTNLTVQAK